MRRPTSDSLVSAASRDVVLSMLSFATARRIEPDVGALRPESPE